MFTDIVDSTAMKSRLGLGVYSRLVSAHDSRMRELVAAIPEAEILKDTGDGFMVQFPTASTAVTVALQFQRFIADLPRPDNAISAGDDPCRFLVRIGVHMGEVADLGPDIYGKQKMVGLAADLSSRVESLALPGQILLTRGAFDDARQFIRADPSSTSGEDSELRWLAHGPYLFKGADAPIEVYEVGVSGVAPLAPPKDSEKAQRVIPPGAEAMYDWRPAAGLPVPAREKWRLLRQIGEGGFGEVWLAKHVQTGVLRVFKFCFNAERLRGLRRELTLFRVLRESLGNRSDIAQLFEVNLDHPPFSIEYEYSPHGDLREWAAQQGGVASMDLAVRLDLLARTAHAVAAAHSAGVLHKDLKPANILITLDDSGAPRPMIIDFGIGMLADPAVLTGHQIKQSGFTETQLTENESSRTGTRLYAPPESLSADPQRRQFTAQGDIYSLGVLLFQLVIGDLDRPVAHGWERDIDPSLAAIIARCIDGDIRRRYGSASELAEAVHSLAQQIATGAYKLEVPVKRAIAPDPAPPATSGAKSVVDGHRSGMPEPLDSAGRGTAGTSDPARRRWIVAVVTTIILLVTAWIVFELNSGAGDDLANGNGASLNALKVAIEPRLKNSQGAELTLAKAGVQLSGLDLIVQISEVEGGTAAPPLQNAVAIPEGRGTINIKVVIDGDQGTCVNYSTGLPIADLAAALSGQVMPGRLARNPAFAVTSEKSLELVVPVLQSSDCGFTGSVKIVFSAGSQ